MKTASIKLAALFSYCGGPLFIAEILKRRSSDAHLTPFLITFLPIGLMVVGSFFLEDDTSDRFSLALVRAGRQGLYAALAMHAYAAWRFLNGTRVPELWLYVTGIVTGTVWSVVYLRAARRWAPAPAGPPVAGDRPAPIEPS